MIDGVWKFVLQDAYEHIIVSYVKFKNACEQIADPYSGSIAQYDEIEPELLLGDPGENWYKYRYYSIQKTF